MKNTHNDFAKYVVKAICCSLLFAFCSLTCGIGVANSASYQSAPPVISHNGQDIYNVQNYSTSQFWSPNAPYNQRIIPQPVYARGPELNTGDCQRAVAAQIASYCQLNNRCSGMRLIDIRPSIMTALSRLPGHNYATACAGFIDSEFDNYMNTTAVSVPQNRSVAFPAGTATIGNSGGELQIKNPYEIKTPKWEQEMNERAAELQDLQSQNGAGSENLSSTDFPKTVADISFLDRVNNIQTGLENPAVQGSAYKKIALNEEEWLPNPECKNARSRLQQMADDLAHVQQCITDGTEYDDCVAGLSGTY